MSPEKESESVKRIADRAMEIHRKDKKKFPLAVHLAVQEVTNITDEQAEILKKKVREELASRGQTVNRHKNKYIGGYPFSSIRHAEERRSGKKRKFPHN